MKAKKTLLPVIVVLLALGLTVFIVKSRKVPQPHATPHLGPLVEVVEVQETDRNILVDATGTVQAKQEVNLSPQVRGTVAKVSPNLVVGGTVKQGELLFAIEDVDYRLAIELAKSNLAKAELDLQRNQNLAKVALQEWQAINSDNVQPDPLVVYVPQVKSAQAQRDAALANVEQAEINLQRTKVYAPFNGFIRSEQVEKGQYINVGAPVVSLVGTEQVEVVVPLPLDDLTWLKIPQETGGGVGSSAEIVLNSGSHQYAWQGVITRALGEVDPRNRMARVVVTVEKPYADSAKHSFLDRLLPGTFVDVQFRGTPVTGVIVVPRGALHDHDTVWVADGQDQLRIRDVEILRRERNDILVTGGLAAGERLVLTNLSAAADGMVLRPQLREAAQ